MRQKGFHESELAKFEQELSVPPKDRLDAIEKLIAQKNFVSAEIAARLLLEDFPGNEVAEQLLQEVIGEWEEGTFLALGIFSVTEAGALGGFLGALR